MSKDREISDLRRKLQESERERKKVWRELLKIRGKYMLLLYAIELAMKSNK